MQNVTYNRQWICPVLATATSTPAQLLRGCRPQHAAFGTLCRRAGALQADYGVACGPVGRTQQGVECRTYEAAADSASLADPLPVPVETKAELVEAVVDEDAPISTLALLRFMLPTLGVWIINPILSLVDMAVVGLRSSTELAALGPGTILCDLNSYLFTFLAVATTNMLAISFARQKRKQAGEVLSDALAISLVLGAGFGAFLYVASPAILQAMTGGAAPAVVAPALSYVRIRCLGIPAAFVIFVTQAYFLAAKSPLMPLKAAAFAGVVNLIGDLALVNGLGWGIAGASLATAAAQIVTAGVLVWGIYKPLPEDSAAPGWRLDVQWRLPQIAALRRFLTYAGPICFVLVTKVAMYNALGAYASSQGAVNSAANHVASTVFAFFATFGDAVSQAAQSFLPAVVGRSRTATKLGKQLVGTGCCIGVVNGILAASVVLCVPWMFTTSPAVIRGVATLAPFLATALTIHTSSMATEGMLMAGRDLTFLVLSYIVNMSLTLGSLLLVRHWGLGVLGTWMCLNQFQLSRLLINGVRLRGQSSPLRSKRPLEPSEAPEEGELVLA